VPKQKEKKKKKGGLQNHKNNKMKGHIGELDGKLIYTSEG